MTRSILLAITLFFASSSWAAPLSAPPLCEFAALPQDQVIEALAESYRGLLEFGGEALLRGAESLEDFFAPVTGRDQRSVALNESLTRLGDWVLLEAEDQGHSLEVIRERLREVVRLHLEKVRQEQERNQSVRIDRASALPYRGFAPESSTGAFGTALVLSESSVILTQNTQGGISIWNVRDFSMMGTIDSSDLLDSKFGIYTLRDPEEFLIRYTESNLLEVWNWRTRSRVRRIELPVPVQELPEDSSSVSLSPSRRYLVSLASRNRMILVDIEAGTVFTAPYATDDNPRLHPDSASWSQDGSRFEITRYDYRDLKTQVASYEVWDASLLATGGEPKRIAHHLVLNRHLPTFQFTADPQVVWFFLGHEIQAFRLKGGGFVAQGPRWRRGDGHNPARGEFYHIGPRSEVEVRSMLDGSTIGGLEKPIFPDSMTGLGNLTVSPSGNFLAASYGHRKKVYVWNLETRRLEAQLDWPVMGSDYASHGFEFLPGEKTLVVHGSGEGRVPVEILFEEFSEH